MERVSPEQLADCVVAARRRWNIPGIAVAIVADGAVVSAADGHDQVEPGSDEHEAAGGTYPRVRRPSGGLWSTVGDLLRFGEHHLGGPGPLTPESIAEPRRPLACRPASTSFGVAMGASSGRVSSSPPCASPARASRCRRLTPPAWRCSLP